VANALQFSPTVSPEKVLLLLDESNVDIFCPLWLQLSVIVNSVAPAGNESRDVVTVLPLAEIDNEGPALGAVP